MMLGADPQLQLHQPQWPLRAFTVHKYGAFGAVRSDAKHGSCGTKDYPCTHYGVDLSAPAGSVVYVPHDGWVLYHGPASAPPFVGYDPWVALIAHADRHTSMTSRIWDWATGPLVDIFDLPEAALSVRYSLIGHLAAPGTVSEVPEPKGAPSPIEVPTVPLAPDIWDASKKSPKPDHWRPLKSAPGSVVMYTDALGATSGRLVFAGNKLGHVSDRDHVHWEMRTAPITPYAGSTWRIDPIEMFRQNYQIPLPPGARIPSRGSGAGWLLLLALLAFGDRRRRR